MKTSLTCIYIYIYSLKPLGVAQSTYYGRRCLHLERTNKAIQKYILYINIFVSLYDYVVLIVIQIYLSLYEYVVLIK